MSKEIIIAVAPVPGEKQDEKYPGTLEVANEVVQCEHAGAAIVHMHARDRNHLQSVDPALFKEQVTQIRENCPIIIEGSTGGAPEHTLEQRCAAFTVSEVEMGSLNLGLDQHVRWSIPKPLRRHLLLRTETAGIANHADHAGVRPVAHDQL